MARGGSSGAEAASRRDREGGFDVQGKVGKAGNPEVAYAAVSAAAAADITSSVRVHRRRGNRRRCRLAWVGEFLYFLRGRCPETLGDLSISIALA